MLTYLKVLDFALIENIEVEFHDGFNVLTGETGAGKTVLIGAIGLLMGERADSVKVRHGAGAATLECVFDLSGSPEVRGELESMGFIPEGEFELVLGRTIPSSGKSRCAVNGRLCPLSTLAAIGDVILDVHGQNTHQALLKTSSHQEYLDRFASGGHLECLAEYRDCYRRLKSLISERRRTVGRMESIERETELLRHETEQIRSAEPQAGELEELEVEAARMRYARELWELSTRVETALASDERTAVGVRELLSGALDDLRRMSSRDRELSGITERVESLMFDIEDIAAGVASYRGRLETDPSRLEEVESRLNLLRDLSRRYGGSLESVLSYLEEAESKLEELEEGMARAEALEEEIRSKREEVAGLAERLTEGRMKAASVLGEAVEKELEHLELSDAGFEVAVRPREVTPGSRDEGGTAPYGPGGSSEVEFLFSPVPGEPVKSLRRIASGGEMSRVMLALKIVLAGADRIPVLIFDEVDAGIGGETAASVGQKLHRLTRFHQVFCVTHIPQIATYADWHYQVFKSGDGGVVHTGIELLSSDDRVEEMCRMLGDSTGRKVTREHAIDILARAREKKEAGGEQTL